MESYYLDSPLVFGEHDFAIIDRMRYPVISGDWPVKELISPMLEPQAHLYPWLLPLKEMHPDDWGTLMQELITQTETPPISCLLLRSDCPTQKVRSQLIKSLHFTDEYHQGHILRYYDPRVLFHLTWMLTPYLLDLTLPVREITHWTFWMEGRWHTLAFPDEFSWKSGEPQTISFKQLQRCGSINQVLKRLPDAENMHSRQQVSYKIDKLLSQAINLQLPTEEDQIAFAFHGLTLQESFWTAPRMSAFLQQAKKVPDFYHDETRLWDKERWNVMTQR